jgi:hypothetical protein
MEEGSYVIRAGEPEFLQTLMLSSCLVPETLPALLTFRRTQFGYEANAAALSGRPFVDSITPVPVDPGNPYLSFKLGDVDIFTVPEERFQQLSQDPDLWITEGPSYLIFLNIAGILHKHTPAIQKAVRAAELSRSALNDHAEILLPADERESAVVPDVALAVGIPEDAPFRLMGERLLIQLKEAGFKVVPLNQETSASIRLIAVQVREADMDLFYYRLLKEQLHVQSEDSWFEEWDRRLAVGEIIPLFLYHSRIAVRKNLKPSSFVSGRPDFSNFWFLETQ